MRKLFKEDSGLAGKVGEWLRKTADKLKSLMNRYARRSDEVRLLKDRADYVERVAGMYAEAMRTAAENYRMAQEGAPNVESAQQIKSEESAPGDAMEGSVGKAIYEYRKGMASAVTQADAEAELNGLISSLFAQYEKGWVEKHRTSDLRSSALSGAPASETSVAPAARLQEEGASFDVLEEGLRKFREALTAYKKENVALPVALERAGLEAIGKDRPEGYSVLAYAAEQIVKQGEKKYAIRQGVTNGGKVVSFVEADRQVITGNDPSQWGKQVTDYINQVIRQGKDVVVYSENGVPLTITEDTAGKAAYRNRDQYGNLYDDEQYALKLRIESHIDEAAQTSMGKGRKADDRKSHSFAQKGFNYRRAFFQDFNGKYYSFQISVGTNGKLNTIYNVNEIKEAELPNTLKGARSQNATVGLTASDNSILQNEEESKRKNNLRTPLEADNSEESQELRKKAVEIFGKTYNWAVTGYVLPNGTRLDFSGKREGSDGRYREEDHRAILDAYGEDSNMSGTDAMIDFMRRGAIRIMPESGGIQLQTIPTKEQLQALDGFISKMRGEVTIDIDDENGDTVFSKEYDHGTFSRTILSEIPDLFEQAQKSRSDTSRFHMQYSKRTPLDAGEEIARSVEGDAELYAQVKTDEDVAAAVSKRRTESICGGQEVFISRLSDGIFHLVVADLNLTAIKKYAKILQLMFYFKEQTAVFFGFSH